MLDFSITQQPDAIEKYFCEPFEKLSRYSMSNDMSRLYLSFTLFPVESDPDIKKQFPVELAKKRIQLFNYSLDDKTITFVALLAGTPGMIVMYLTYLAYWAKKHNRPEIDFVHFGKAIFPLGFPSEKDLHKLWDTQKVKRSEFKTSSDNLLDYTSAWQSLLFPVVLKSDIIINPN